MRKIQTPEETERRKKRNNTIIGGFFIFLLLFSTAGFALFSGTGSTPGNVDDSGDGGGFGSNFDGRYWTYQRSGQQYFFSNTLELSQKIDVQITNTFESYTGNILYVDSQDQEALSEISINLGRHVNRIQQACYESCEENLPEIGCSGEDAENLIIFVDSEEKNVYQENNCVFIEGDLVSMDAFLFKILGFT